MSWIDGFNFDLTDEERMAQEMARSFARERVQPLAASIDREHRYPKEIIAALAELGLMGVFVPAACGGAGLSQVAYALIIEELAAACASTAIIVSAHSSLASWPILQFGTEAQKERYLKPLARGAALGCFALSEPGTGSDVANLSCTVRREGKNYIINGTKNWITNGSEANTCVLFATHDATKGSRGISAFVHPLSEPGITRGKAEDKLGIRGSPTCALQYDNVCLSEEHLLGEEERGFRVAMLTLDGGRIGVAAQAVGIARAALADALGYAKQRKAFGVYLHEHQSIQNYLAEMVTRIDAARYLTVAAARLKDEGKPYTRQAAQAKLFASETAMFVANKGVQIHGGYGFVTDFPAERHLRDAKITEIYEGTSEIQRIVIGAGLVKDV